MGHCKYYFKMITKWVRTVTGVIAAPFFTPKKKQNKKEEDLSDAVEDLCDAMTNFALVSFIPLTDFLRDMQILNSQHKRTRTCIIRLINFYSHAGWRLCVENSLSCIFSESHANISFCLFVFASTSHIPCVTSMRLSPSCSPYYNNHPSLPHSFQFSSQFYSSFFFFLIYAQRTKHSILAVSAVAEIAVNEKRSPFIFFILPLLSACSL